MPGGAIPSEGESVGLNGALYGGLTFFPVPHRGRRKRTHLSYCGLEKKKRLRDPDQGQRTERLCLFR